MGSPQVQLSIISNVWIKLLTFQKGDVMDGHRHVFDHPHLLTQGSVEVNVEGVLSTFKAPHIIFIEKDKLHSITALEDNTVGACIHAIRNGTRVEDVIDPSMIPAGTTVENLRQKVPTAQPLAYGIKPENM